MCRLCAGQPLSTGTAAAAGLSPAMARYVFDTGDGDAFIEDKKGLDVPLTRTFGPAELVGFKVWTDEIKT